MKTQDPFKTAMVQRKDVNSLTIIDQFPKEFIRFLTEYIRRFLWISDQQHDENIQNCFFTCLGLNLKVETNFGASTVEQGWVWFCGAAPAPQHLPSPGPPAQPQSPPRPSRPVLPRPPHPPPKHCNKSSAERAEQVLANLLNKFSRTCKKNPDFAGQVLLNLQKCIFFWCFCTFGQCGQVLPNLLDKFFRTCWPGRPAYLLQPPATRPPRPPAWSRSWIGTWSMIWSGTCFQDMPLVQDLVRDPVQDQVQNQSVCETAVPSPHHHGLQSKALQTHALFSCRSVRSALQVEQRVAYDTYSLACKEKLKMAPKIENVLSCVIDMSLMLC